jgi:hypothetical protein
MDPTTAPRHATAHAVGVIGFTAIALIHVLDLPSKLHETPYLGGAYLALIAGMLYASFEILRGHDRRGWIVGGAGAALTVAAYAVNRLWGLPGATDDVGNWLEPLGLASLFVESVIALLAAWVLTAPAPEVAPPTRHTVRGRQQESVGASR